PLLLVFKRPLASFHQELSQALEPATIGFVEPGYRRAVNIEHAQQALVLDQGNNNLRLRRRITRNVSGKLVYIPNHERLASCGCRAAYAFAEWDSYAGGFPLERTHYKLALLAQEIESYPVDVRQGIEQQCRCIGRVRDEVGLTGEQAAELRSK